MGSMQHLIFNTSCRALRILATLSNRILCRDFYRLVAAFILGIILTQLRISTEKRAGHNDSQACISNKLYESELNWRRSSRKIFRSEAKIQPGHYPNQETFSTMDNQTVIWNYFPPSFDCPMTKERLGTVGDGGKWVCGIRHLAKRENCVVYSFGVRGETSFEDEILTRTRCRVHLFDPTGEAKYLPILPKFPGRVTFDPVAIGGEDINGYKTLRTFMGLLKDSFIDILKIDIEGAEWEVLRNIWKDFQTELPFAQLQIELHLDRIHPDRQYEALRSMFTALTDAGLRPFSIEPNQIFTSGIYTLQEISFVNVKSPLSPFYLKFGSQAQQTNT